MQLTDRLEALAKRFDEIEAALASQSGAFDQERYTALVKERAALAETVEVYRDYRKTLAAIAENDVLLEDRADPELHALAEEEAAVLRERRKALEARLQELMLPRDPNDAKDIFIEIRAGAGGEEASLFAAELARMYARYAESKGMRVSVVSQSEYESGVHRVQRVPVTEASGRVHTSTATVAVLPEAEEVEIEINPKDLQIDT